MIDNNSKEFIYRHIGPSELEQKSMLKEVGYNSLDDSNEKYSSRKNFIKR